jgi:hypothetical protein
MTQVMTIKPLHSQKNKSWHNHTKQQTWHILRQKILKKKVLKLEKKSDKHRSTNWCTAAYVESESDTDDNRCEWKHIQIILEVFRRHPG